MRHVGGVDEIGLVGKVGSDLWKQVEWKTVEGRLEGIDVTAQYCECHVYIVLQGLHLRVKLRTGRDTFEDEYMEGDEPSIEMGCG